jgi:hypothetical protein
LLNAWLYPKHVNLVPADPRQISEIAEYRKTDVQQTDKDFCFLPEAEILSNKKKPPIWAAKKFKSHRYEQSINIL